MGYIRSSIYYLILLFLLSCGSFSDSTKKLGKDYVLVVDGKGSNRIFVQESTNEDQDIPSDVVAYNYNKEFIIVKQKPNEFDDSEEPHLNYSKGRDSLYYYIIIKKDRKRLGPLEYEEYLKLKRQYNIPDKLQLKSP